MNLGKQVDKALDETYDYTQSLLDGCGPAVAYAAALYAAELMREVCEAVGAPTKPSEDFARTMRAYADPDELRQIFQREAANKN